MQKKFDLREERQKLGLTQGKLAELLDITPQYVGMLENGHKTVSKKLVKRFEAIRSPIHAEGAVNNGGSQVIGHGSSVGTLPQLSELSKDIADLKERMASIEKLLIKFITK